MAAPHPTGIHWNAAKQGKFVTALCRDHHGNLWVGTEDHGVWEYHTKTHKWQQFTVASTGGNPKSSKLGSVLTAGTPNEHALGDNHIYAIACDKLGRIWVGHINHGVSVYNGKSWENYDVINGPLGERVFDIATSPVDGDVWIATDEGLARYSLSHDKWLYYTKGPGNQGLPSNQIEAIAFAKDGTLYAATQCHGLAICHLLPNYAPKNPLVSRQWRTVTSKYVGSPPLIPMGRGLPSNLLNDVLVAHDGTVWVATDEGLAWSKDKGRSWRFVRGRDWQAKDEGLYPPKVTSAQVQAIAKKYAADHDLLLSEDHCTALAEDGDGDIWIGHWRSGVEMIDPRTGKHYQSRYDPLFQGGKKKKVKNAPFARQGPTDDVFSLIALPDQPPVIGFYGGGLVQMPDKFKPKKMAPPTNTKTRRQTSAHTESTPSPLPTPATPPTKAQLEALIPLLKRSTVQAATIQYPYAKFLGEDWTTEGDWVGRYGMYDAVLCAGAWPASSSYTAPGSPGDTTGFSGPHHKNWDALRQWQLWSDKDLVPCLYMPLVGHRRQASWDDHGEAYPITHQGPNLWLRIHLGKGLYRVSLYFVNINGHLRGNRQRDYTVGFYQLLPSALAAFKSTEFQSHTHICFPNNPAALAWVRANEKHGPLVRARVEHFWRGEYLRFLVAGPGQYLVHLNRNDSLNTIISGIFIDKAGRPVQKKHVMTIHEKDGKIFTLPIQTQPDDIYGDPTFGDVTYRAPKTPLARQVFGEYTYMRLWRSAINAFGPMTWQMRHAAMILNYRFALTHRIPMDVEKLKVKWRWYLDLWSTKDRKDFDQTMNKAFASFLNEQPKFAKWMAKWHMIQPNSGRLGKE